MAALVWLSFQLTQKQAELLGMVACGKALASELPAWERATWRKIHDEVRSSETAAKGVDAERAERTRPCKFCGRAIVYAKRGNRVAAHHDCPHGHVCVSRHSCLECRKVQP